jgi:hypothetical protein
VDLSALIPLCKGDFNHLNPAITVEAVCGADYQVITDETAAAEFMTGLIHIISADPGVEGNPEVCLRRASLLAGTIYLQL